MKNKKCYVKSCSICPVDKCSMRKEEPQFGFRCNGSGNCYLCDKANRYSIISKIEPIEFLFGICKNYSSIRKSKEKLVAK